MPEGTSSAVQNNDPPIGEKAKKRHRKSHDGIIKTER